MEKKSKFLSVKQVADYLEVSKQAVDKWIHAGELKVYRLPSGRIKILRSDFLDYIKMHDLYLDKEFFSLDSGKIVVIDDDESIHGIFQKFFEEINTNLEVQYANDGISGLLLLGSLKPDVVILDIEMPGMNGIELCKKILEDSSLSGIKIVVISGYLINYEVELKKFGLNIFIEKPFSLQDLNSKLMPLINAL